MRAVRSSRRACACAAAVCIAVCCVHARVRLSVGCEAAVRHAEHGRAQPLPLAHKVGLVHPSARAPPVDVRAALRVRVPAAPGRAKYCSTPCGSGLPRAYHKSTRAQLLHVCVRACVRMCRLRSRSQKRLPHVRLNFGPLTALRRGALSAPLRRRAGTGSSRRAGASTQP